MDRVDGEQTGQAASIKKQVAAASFIGTTIEWYDFFLYGSAAALVFGQVFFLYADTLIGTLSSFATFAVIFVARLLGGMIFYEDRIGRKTMLAITTETIYI
jgi:MHS family shikimate/dehydroshikimate transporter-like MFS transporter